MTPNPAPGPAAPPPQKKSAKGCIIALAVVFGIFGLICLVGAFITWRAANSPEGKKIVSAIGKGAELGMKGMNAPGAKEVRNLGCRQAIILKTRDILDIVAIFADGGMNEDDPQLDSVMVLCQGNVFDDLPECQSVADTYVKAVHPTADFMVSVRQQGKGKPLCEGKYDPNGEYLGAFGGKKVNP